MVFNSWKFSPILSHHTLLWRQNSFKFLLRVVNRQLKQGWDEEPLIENYFESFLTNFYMCRRGDKEMIFFFHIVKFSASQIVIWTALKFLWNCSVEKWVCGFQLFICLVTRSIFSCRQLPSKILKMITKMVLRSAKNVFFLYQQSKFVNWINLNSN